MTELTEVTNASHKAIKAAYCDHISDVIERQTSKSLTAAEANTQLSELHEEIIMLMARRNGLRRQCQELRGEAQALQEEVKHLATERALMADDLPEIDGSGLNSKALIIYSFLLRYFGQYNRAPTYREMGEAVELSWSNVAHHLGSLEEVGLIRRRPSIARGIEITGRLV